jgi:hypothetical protein
VKPIYQVANSRRGGSEAGPGSKRKGGCKVRKGMRFSKVVGEVVGSNSFVDRLIVYS